MLAAELGSKITDKESVCFRNMSCFNFSAVTQTVREPAVASRVWQKVVKRSTSTERLRQGIALASGRWHASKMDILVKMHPPK